MYIGQAQELEEQGRFKDAEKLYISVNEPDLAISSGSTRLCYDAPNLPPGQNILLLNSGYRVLQSLLVLFHLSFLLLFLLLSLSSSPHLWFPVEPGDFVIFTD